VVAVPNRPPGAIDPARATPVNHFTAFGIPIVDLATESDVLKQVVADVHQTGGWFRSPGGELTSCAWIDPSGVRLDLLLDQDSRVVCATPQLEVCRGSQVVRVQAIVDDPSADGCPGCSLVEADLLLASGRVRPLMFAPADVAPRRESFKNAAAQLRTVQVGMVLVVEAVSRLGSSDGSVRTTLIQVSQLSRTQPRVTVRATCRVTAVAERETSFGHRFWYLQVECLGHCFDMVADPAILPTVCEGEVLNLLAGVCGRAWW
jgi:hypothetical protein